MSECTELELRESLPDLANGRTDSALATRVRAHLTACASCREEFELLRELRTAWHASVPAVDTARIVAALPRPRAVAARPARWSSQMTGLRIAAVLGLMTVGGVSVALLRDPGSPMLQGDTLAVAVTRPTVAVDTPQLPPTSSSLPVATRTVSVVPDLHDDDLETLIGALDALEAAPSADPDSLIIVRAGAVTGGA